MFDFEKLEVYQRAHRLTIDLLRYLAGTRQVDDYFRDQLRRAMISVPLNISEGVGRVSAAEKKRFYTMARSSVYECVAILSLLKDGGFLPPSDYQNWYDEFTTLSKMLLNLYRTAKDMP